MTKPGRKSWLIVAFARRKPIKLVAEQICDVVWRFAGAIDLPRVNHLSDALIAFVAHHDEARLAMTRDQDGRLGGGVSDFADLLVEVIGCEGAHATPGYPCFTLYP